MRGAGVTRVGLAHPEVFISLSLSCGACRYTYRAYLYRENSTLSHPLLSFLSETSKTREENIKEHQKSIYICL